MFKARCPYRLHTSIHNYHSQRSTGEAHCTSKQLTNCIKLSLKSSRALPDPTKRSLRRHTPLLLTKYRTCIADSQIMLLVVPGLRRVMFGAQPAPWSPAPAHTLLGALVVRSETPRVLFSWGSCPAWPLSPRFPLKASIRPRFSFTSPPPSSPRPSSALLHNKPPPPFLCSPPPLLPPPTTHTIICATPAPPSVLLPTNAWPLMPARR